MAPKGGKKVAGKKAAAKKAKAEAAQRAAAPPEPEPEDGRIQLVYRDVDQENIKQ